MIKKRITWKDFLGDSHTEDFYFHLKQDELVEIELGNPGSTFSTYLQTMVKSEDKSEILKAFKMIISASYGKRSEDGRRFEKDEAWTKEFMKSQAYTALFMELVTDEKSAVEFIMGVFPAEMMEDPDMQATIRQAMATGGVKVDIKLPGQSFKVSDKDIRPMTDEELAKRMALPAGFRRPPTDSPSSTMIPAGQIVLPQELQNITREELLAAYDRQMGKKDPDVPPPPAA
jgi:hypothetical protein